MRVTAAYRPTIGPTGRMSLENATLMPRFMGVATGLLCDSRAPSSVCWYRGSSVYVKLGCCATRIESRTIVASVESGGNIEK